MHWSKPALSLLACLGASTTLSTHAFSSRAAASFVRPTAKNPIARASSSVPVRMVASAETTPIAEMQRGIGGRLEDAFGAAKERGEAAFVTFVTAGYPTAQGEFRVALYWIVLFVWDLPTNKNRESFDSNF
jgi:hypothetical protein